MTIIETIYAGNLSECKAKETTEGSALLNLESETGTTSAECVEPKGVWEVLMSKLPQHINLVVVYIVVAVPEGLPMTVGISLAFSVMNMFKDGILIRKLGAPE
jgi:hypothetical protein